MIVVYSPEIGQDVDKLNLWFVHKAKKQTSNNDTDKLTPSPMTTLFIDSTPCVSVDTPLHGGWAIRHLLALSDGSIVTCSEDTTAKRWLIGFLPTIVDDHNDEHYDDEYKDNNTPKLVGTFSGHQHWVYCAVEKDSTSIITASSDTTLKEWDIASCECLRTVSVDPPVHCMIKAKSKPMIVCGSWGGGIALRRTSDLSIISSFEFHSSHEIHALCELGDGTFISGSYGYMKHWNESGEELRTFSWQPVRIIQIMSLKRDIIVTASDDGKKGATTKIWKVSTGECLHTDTRSTHLVQGLVKLSDSHFVSGSSDEMIEVWNDKGECFQTIEANHCIDWMTRVGDVLVTVNAVQLEIRRLK